MNSTSIPSTMLTIQKFLSAFLDRLSKAKLSIEAMDLPGKEIGDSRQLSTRIIQQWNMLFPNSPIHCLDSLSSNTLIATKTREEISLDRLNNQKLKLMMEVEVVQSRIKQQKDEITHLQEEITKHTNYMNMNNLKLQELQQQRQTILTTINSLQSQKEQEDSTLQSLQSSKLTILEELVSLQHATTTQRTSIQALLTEKQEQTKKLEQMKNEYLLLEREIEVVKQKQKEINSTLLQKQEIFTHSSDQIENRGNQTETMTGKTILSENSTNTVNTIQADESIIPLDYSFQIESEWKSYGRRKRHRKDLKYDTSSTKRIILQQTTNIFDDSFW